MTSQALWRRLQHEMTALHETADRLINYLEDKPFLTKEEEKYLRDAEIARAWVESPGMF